MGMTSGQIIGSVGGGIVGGLVGGFPGAMMGMALGGMIGGWVTPPPAPDPPPLGDLGLNTYVHNAPVALAYGQVKAYGGCIWIGNVATAMSDGGSKKNPEYSPQMWLEFAVAHCEGEVTQYLKYWINDKEVYEVAEEGMQFSFTSYNGTSSQTVNSAISAYLSGSMVPACAYIHTAYTYVFAFWDGGYFNTIPNFSVEVKARLCESGEEDANPIRVLYDFLTDTRIGPGLDTAIFDGDPDTADSSWKIASDYCDESVSYIDSTGATVNEPRFRYSMVFDTRMKAHDIIADILLSCRGIISWVQGKIYVKIENGNEDIEFYYSDFYQVTFTSAASTVGVVNVTTTIDEPDDFWAGAYLSFTQDDIEYQGMVASHSGSAFTMYEDLLVAPNSGINITVTKDNIKEGSFDWTKKSVYDRSNAVRLEFINRKFLDVNTGIEDNQYQWDVVEYETPEHYIDVEFEGSYYWYYEDDLKTTVRCAGIKRKSQAYRMAKWFADQSSYINYVCSFITGTIGYIHGLGDIIGVSHSQLGWQGKLFRVVSVEEEGNDEIKLTCVDYNPSLYGDTVLQVFESSSSVIPSVYSVPDDIERFNVGIGISGDRTIWFHFKRPDNNNWWVGAKIYVKKGASADYDLLGQWAQTTASVKLDTGGIDSSQTTIPYDVSTLYGSFPDSGQIYIENERIAYTSINDTLDQFEGCTRSVVNPSSHADTEYCNYHKPASNPSITYTAADAGATWYFKAVSVTVTGTPSELADADEVSVTLT
jgi:hypothetical protein